MYLARLFPPSLNRFIYFTFLSHLEVGVFSDFSSGQCTDTHKSINVSAGIFECIGQGLYVGILL